MGLQNEIDKTIEIIRSVKNGKEKVKYYTSYEDIYELFVDKLSDKFKNKEQFKLEIQALYFHLLDNVTEDQYESFINDYFKKSITKKKYIIPNF